MIQIIISAGLAAVISGAFSLANILLQRKWKNEDEKNRCGSEVLTKLDNLKKTLDEHIAEDGRKTAKDTRSRILQFNDEVSRGEHHSKESWDNTLEDIDYYEAYCRQHPEFPNNKAILAINNIKTEYARTMRASEK